MKIRKATIKDLKECEKISQIPELDLDYYGNRPSVKYLRQFLDQIFLVATEENKVVGYIMGEKNKYKFIFINLIAVDKKYRGKGAGKLLLKEFEKNAKKMKFKEIGLLSPKWNKKTLEFYKKAGFYEMKYYTYFTKEI